MFKKSLFVKVTSLALTVILVCGMMASCGGKKFGSDAEYVGYVNAQEIEKASGVMENVSEFEFDAGNVSLSLDLEIELGDAGRELIEKTGLLDEIGLDDIDWFEKVSAEIDINWEDRTFQMEGDVGLNGEEIVSAYMGADIDNEKIYVGIPTYSSKYVEMPLPEEVSESFDELDEAFNDSEASEMLKNVTKDMEMFPHLISKYISIAFENIDEVDKGKDKLEVGGISQSCTKYTATIDGDAIKKVAKGVLSELKDDKDVKKILEDFGVFENMDESDFEDELDRALEQIDEADPEENGFPGFDYVSYIDDDELIGLELSLEVDGEDVDIHSYNVKDGKKFASETVIDVPGEVSISFEGDGKCSGDEYTGEFGLYVNGTKFAKVFVDDLDAEALEGGSFEGSVTISPAEGLLQIISSEVDIPNELSVLLKMFGIRFSSDGDKFEIALVNGDDLYISIKIGFDISNNAKVSFPKNTTEDPEELLKDFDPDDLIDKFNDAGVPSELLEMFEGLEGELEEELN